MSQPSQAKQPSETGQFNQSEQPNPAAETRFAFGQNWSAFLQSFDQERLDQAVASLRSLLQLGEDPQTLGTRPLEPQPLAGLSFLDIGSGSGLFSLAAIVLGARVVSLDVDADSYQCTLSLKERITSSSSNSASNDASGADPTATAHKKNDIHWDVHHASILDAEAMRSLGQFDIVYSWGVLHHTGQMKTAVAAAAARVSPGGQLAIAIYNDQGGGSRRWLAIKHGYHRLPAFLRPGYVVAVAGFYECKFALARLARGRNPLPFADWQAKKSDRGMSVWHDWVDWIGGLPFEVATPEAIVMPLRQQGFTLDNLRTVGSGWGCNEFVFRLTESTGSPQ